MLFSRCCGGKFENALLVKPFYNRITRKLYKMFSIPCQIEVEKRNEEKLILQHIDTDVFTPLTDSEKKAVVDFYSIIA